jgi:hypothetical protein
MEQFKRALVIIEEQFDDCKRLKIDYDIIKNECKDEYYVITFEYIYKYKHLIMLLLKSMVNDMPMTYYLSICEKIRNHLYDSLDVKGLNEGDYLTWADILKNYKNYFDNIIDIYTEYKINEVKFK